MLGKSVVLLVLLLVLGSHVQAEDISRSPSSDWKLEAEGDGVQIYSRPRPGTSLKEYKGVGTIDVPPAVVAATLRDRAHYPEFIPYISECRVLRREGNTLLVYQRLDVPFLSDRDYTQRVTEMQRSSGRDTVYELSWRPANAEGPPPKKGVTRIEDFEGSWLLEPAGENGTRATFRVFTETKNLPPFVANNGSRVGVAKLFASLRKRVLRPEYRQAGGR